MNLIKKYKKLRSDFGRYRACMRVLRLKDKGYTNVQIAEKLGLNESLVRVILEVDEKQRMKT